MHHNEKWQEFYQDGERIMNGGRSPKNGTPKFGEENVWVGTTIVWLYRRTRRGVELLFQKRSSYVDRFPNKWDISAGGHVNYGESVAEAAIRETREEIGVEIDKEELKYSFSLAASNDYNIFIHAYFCDWTGREDDFCFDDEEVSDTKWVSLEDFDDFVEKNTKEALKEAKFTLKLTKYWAKYYGNLQAE